MAKKTAIRKLSKRLPSSTDVQQTFGRDDDLYDLKALRTIPDDVEDDATPVRSLEDFGNRGRKRNGRDKPPARRGRKPKAESEAEPGGDDWLTNYKEKVAQAETADEVGEAWAAIEDDFEVADPKTKKEVSDLYNARMNQLGVGDDDGPDEAA